MSAAAGQHKNTNSITQYLLQQSFSTPFPYHKSYSHVPHDELDGLLIQRKSHDFRV